MNDKLTRIQPYSEEALHKNSDIPLEGVSDKPNREAAVLVPLVHHSDQWHLLFIRRASSDVDRHSGQVAFPGGRLETADASHVDAALRETHEEIGVPPSLVNVLGTIETYVTISHYAVTPVVGVVSWPTPLILQRSEVARAFLIPLAWLRSRENFSMRARKEMDPHSARRHPIVVYNEFDGEVLWGATARMTLNFIKALDAGTLVLPASME